MWNTSFGVCGSTGNHFLRLLRKSSICVSRLHSSSKLLCAAIPNLLSKFPTFPLWDKVGWTEINFQSVISQRNHLPPALLTSEIFFNLTVIRISLFLRLSKQGMWMLDWTNSWIVVDKKSISGWLDGWRWTILFACAFNHWKDKDYSTPFCILAFTYILFYNWSSVVWY